VNGGDECLGIADWKVLLYFVFIPLFFIPLI